MKLVECVPNFSEGRDAEKIKAITDAIEAAPGIKLLDVDPGASTNRTVVTFIGPPEAVAEAAFQGIAKAAEIIDMRGHKGAHSRMGATDVCPFVPVTGVTMDDCVRLAGELGRRVADELGIPVYLYEAAARRPERRNLATIRAGEYEGLPDKLKDPAWAPDFGASVFNPKSGATIVGAREFLIAYNINLNTRDRRLAHEIALSLRESGRAKRDKDGNLVKDVRGGTVKVPGKFKEVKAVGWYVEDYGLAQISVNFTNYKVTPVHVVFDEAVRLAAKLGLRVTGSELVGLIPKEALLMAGRHYLEKQGKSPGVPEAELVRTAVRSLGLGDVVPFEPEKKIIEDQVREPGPALAAMSLRGFVDELSMDSPAPGGGSVAALCGALAAGLAAMVANLTVGKTGYEAVHGDMVSVAVRAQTLKDALLAAVDEDTEAFNKVMEAFRLPKTTPEQAEEKDRAVEAANREATLVPLRVLEMAVEAIGLARTAAAKGNRNSVSDAGVAGLAAQAAGEGAHYNVLINLAGIKDAAFAGRVRRQAARLRRTLDKEAKAVRAILARALAGPAAG
ncbi:MAG TPA: glutamate formimidoyltransferase [Candidatus Aminicenantes bacterium]|nr:glutamate formimidoyltransferase [Candidatus Aminicenantes bacterium]